MWLHLKTHVSFFLKGQIRSYKMCHDSWWETFSQTLMHWKIIALLTVLFCVLIRVSYFTNFRERCPPWHKTLEFYLLQKNVNPMHLKHQSTYYVVKMLFLYMITPFPERYHNQMSTTKNDVEYYLPCDFKLDTECYLNSKKKIKNLSGGCITQHVHIIKYRWTVYRTFV